MPYSAGGCVRVLFCLCGACGTARRYMCFNRFLTKEHLRELILRDPAK
jgi:hypothetical protein